MDGVAPVVPKMRMGRKFRPWPRRVLVLGLLVTLVPGELPDTVPRWPGYRPGPVSVAKLDRPPVTPIPPPTAGVLPGARRTAPVLEVPVPLRPPYMDWPHGSANLGTTLDRVREDIGVTVTPADFDQDPRGSVQLYGTPFGQDLHVNLFMQWAGTRWAVSLWNQVSETAYFPGVDVQLVEVPLTRGPHPILFTPRFGVWTQPVVPSLDANTSGWGVLGSAVLEVPLDENLWVWIEGGGKTAGWVPGGEADGPRLSIRTGLHWSL